MATAKVKDRAKEIAAGQGGEDTIVTLSTGVRVRLHPVSASLVEEIRSAIPDPPVPRVWIEAKEREEENPNDPAYLAAVDRTERKRGDAALDALVTFGVELLDGLPEDGAWLKRLLLLQKTGRLNLSGFDLEDEFDREFLYKRYVAVAGIDYPLVGGLHGLDPREVIRSRTTFLGDEAGDSD